MRLAYVSASERGATDACLARAAALLLRSGHRLAGGVQTNHYRPESARCDMDLMLLPDGPSVRISQDLGPFAEGCRLDADALESAAVEVARRLPRAQVLIVNKFGKQEQIGRGFVPLIITALGDGIPVVVGVNPVNLAGFLAFADGHCTALPPDPATVVAWVAEACAAPA